jgi:hypothetical protein
VADLDIFRYLPLVEKSLNLADVHPASHFRLNLLQASAVRLKSNLVWCALPRVLSDRLNCGGDVFIGDRFIVDHQPETVASIA